MITNFYKVGIHYNGALCQQNFSQFFALKVLCCFEAKILIRGLTKKFHDLEPMS